MTVSRETSPGAPGIVVVRCNPFGHSTGRGGDRGPRHLMGGLYSAAHEGAKKWFCPNPADGRYRMTCQCDPPHRGQEMPLCYSHVAMIGRRMSGICPPCVMPPAALELHERIQAAQAGAALLIRSGADREAIARAVSEADQLGQAMTELVTRGIAHRCQLTLTEVSLHSHKNRGLEPWQVPPIYADGPGTRAWRSAARGRYRPRSGRSTTPPTPILTPSTWCLTGRPPGTAPGSPRAGPT